MVFEKDGECRFANLFFGLLSNSITHFCVNSGLTPSFCSGVLTQANGDILQGSWRVGKISGPMDVTLSKSNSWSNPEL
jgi:hypothetical protein